ncbi:hypothetical protein VOLCADRAFT_98757 [Volvox carteri f. nagariensis]|uniref:Uncharacterized protein n=1 Tax=Volvox carteri f. nagariensis TaxID=3068 RepID=D8UG76_VOLCA|nr:uncharacterized protein VOLCADRAFT_98757 [Volvox carteri f. nagariensis]EFJ41302.1 hypothetical protein VOLCADRAFT_98757 [Volvox carteri f. nagariensis]|eukprot:XP_002957636.1 hypothetical protein VOLCADRAFT_98757 [Volvox carteri f. nagariensis]
MGLTDMLSSAVRGHTGLHYMPSFNDFVSGAADDVEAMELQHDQQTRMTPLTSDAPKPVSNKTDDLPAMTSTIGDIHKAEAMVMSIYSWGWCGGNGERCIIGTEAAHAASM